MLAAQRKDQAVIERRPLPTAGRSSMTGRAVGGEPGLLVIGIGRRLIIRQVTACTGGRGSRVLAVGMTESAVGDGMLAAQRKDQAVIERRPLPTAGRSSMTRRAVGRETGLLVIGIGRALIIRQVTACTGGRCSRVLAVGMTESAVGDGMLAVESKRSMLEIGSPPLTTAHMAELTIGRKPRRRVIGPFCGLELTRVTNVALGRDSSKAPASVTLGALQSSMLAI